MTTTPSVPTWKTEFNERIKAFATAIGVEEPKVRESLAELGADGKSEQSLIIIDNDDFTPIGDLRGVFVDTKLTRLGQLRAGLPHLRGATRINDDVAESTNGKDSLGEVAGAIKDMVASNRPKSDWSDRELLETYDEDATEIAEVLRKRSKARYCIVFKKDGTVNVEVSLGLLRTAKRQPTSDEHRVDGQAVRVYRPGEFLAKALDESPFAPGVVLVSDYCSTSDTDWTGVSYKRRVMIRLHIQKVETAQLSTREMQRICKDAHGMGDEQFDSEYSKAAMIYAELEEQDKLPKLKIMPSEIKPTGRTGWRTRDSGF